jgi:uncharacterized OB-fold protein
LIEGLVLPDVADPESGPFWEGCARGELLVQRCGSCGRRRVPPRPMCPWCRSLDDEWEAVSGRGTVWSFVVAHPPLLPAYQAFAPYNVVVVSLDEDPALRLVGNLVADEGAPVNSVDPATIRIGEPVRVVFDRVADGVVLPRWARA